MLQPKCIITFPDLAFLAHMMYISALLLVILYINSHVQESGKWVFDDAREHCKIIHPLARENLLERETHTRVYKVYLSRYYEVMQFV